MNEEFLDGVMGQMIRLAELQTNMGQKLTELEAELKGIQDAVHDVHSAVTTRFDAVDSQLNDLDRIWEK